MDDFERELMAAFALEAVEHVQGMTAGLLDLERGVVDADGEPLIVRVYRQAHSLKGAARTVGLAPVERICQALENVLAAMRSGQLRPQPAQWDELQGAIAAVDRLLADPNVTDVDADGIAERLNRVASTPSVAEPPAPPPSVVQPVAHLPAESAVPPSTAPIASATQTIAALPRQRQASGAHTLPQAGADAVIRVQVRKIEALFAHSEDLLGAAFSQRARLAEVRALMGRVAAWRKALEDDEFTREAPPLGDQVVGMVKSMLAEVRQLEQSLAQDCATLDRQVRDLTDAARAVLLQPMVGALEPFHKLVRDLGRDQAKPMQLAVHDAGISVDRRILEALRDPLVHLLRNAVDHGIESAAERRTAGKPVTAQISLIAQHVGVDTVELRIEDDGRGLNFARLRERAVALGLADASDLQSWSDAMVADLAFATELSTAEKVSSLSGRGLGLAIVRQAIEALGGTARVGATSGEGTAFVLRLPVSLASFRGVVVQAGGSNFVVPSRAVERALRWQTQSLGTVSGTTSLAVDGAQLPAHRLDSLLGLPASPRRDGASESGSSEIGLVIQAGGRRVVLVVDALFGEQEGLVKGLGPLLRSVRGVSGVATLASHALVPVLDPGQLLAVTRRHVALSSSSADMPAFDVPVPGHLRAGGQATIMVAEDSATARLLLVHVLEGAGYKVWSAGNGAEALAMLQAEHCDALVSDVEMAVMNGFELTAAVRADPKLADLPVILVTSLESRADRSRGAAAGANAYVVKRNFEPTVLLQALERWL